MKKSIILWNVVAFMMALTLSLSTTSCGPDPDDDKKTEPTPSPTPASTLSVSGLDAPFDAAAGNIQVAQELTITCNNVEWTIEGKPDWLDISALSGKGNSTVKVWTNSANSSTSERTATLTVKTNTESASKTVTQRAGLDANLQVSPNTVVVLADGYAFDYNFGSKVKYYYVKTYDPSALDRKTDDEIIADMSSDASNRDTPSDGYVTSWGGLSPLTEFVVCTVGYDQNGNHGALKKTSITTKSSTNQAKASIVDVTCNETYWHWKTEVNGFVSKYYQWVITSTKLYDMPDACIAWFFKDNMNKYPDDFKPMIQGGEWQAKRNGGNVFHVATWALDVNGELSSVIGRFKGIANSSSQKAINKNYVEDYGSLKRFKTLK